LKSNAPRTAENAKEKTFVRVSKNMRDAKNFNFAPSHYYQIGPNGSIAEKKIICQKNERKTKEKRFKTGFSTGKHQG
jgi:hypothetical protein